MNKALIQDIKQPKRPLAEVLPTREAPLPERPTRVAEAAPATRLNLPRRRGRSLGLIIFLILIIGLPLFYFSSQWFASAQVLVKQKRTVITLNSELVRAVALPAEPTTDLSGKLGFEVMTVSASDSIAVPAAEKKQVSEKASGKIVIVNRYSQRPQKLVASTRFESSPGGKIYRIKDEISVPGYELKDGKLTPGEVTVTVYADKAGADYNGEVKNFVIPGFKTDANKYEKLTARGEGSMAGGFVGERRIVSAEDEAKASAELRDRIEKSLKEEITAALPDGFFTFPDAAFFTSNVRVKDGATTTSESMFEMDGQFSVLTFSERELAQLLAKTHLTGYEEAEIKVSNLPELKFTLLNRNTVNLETSKDIGLSLSGSAQIVWLYDEELLKRSLAGVAKTDYQSIFTKVPSITSAEVTVRPPWLKRFPVDPSKILVRVDQ